MLILPFAHFTFNYVIIWHSEHVNAAFITGKGGQPTRLLLAT